ncbi:dynein regulatory complex subunit 6 [Chelonus insularis]|uniref:dynein regulatory complex subunit 6 n=1 Tax=Chelonus insularis TaxID=460826 RepID=UPI001588AA30|nr:dynein regulatory complex subunit 6 [Chelonus insularis]
MALEDVEHDHTDDINTGDNLQLPIEVIIHIMSYLSVSDRMSAGLVCREWHEASLTLRFVNKQAVIVSREEDNLQLVMNTLLKSQRPFYHFIFKEVEVKRNLPIWDKFGSSMRSLILVCCDLSERTLVSILKCLKNLRILHINACRECLMSGRLLDDKKDVDELSQNFQSLIELSLASNRYLSDALFNRFVSICPNLQSLSLTDCQISFHSGVYKRFYRDYKSSDQASESLLTFFNVLAYIKKQAKRLKHLSFGSTLIDSTALSSLASIEELKLESLKLKSCDQLTNTGLRSLIYQTNIKVLDISFCTRVTDASIICICKNLHNIEILNIRRCRAVTDLGIKQIHLLKKLKELDISECDQLTGACITQGLCQPTITEDVKAENNDDQNLFLDFENVNPNCTSELIDGNLSQKYVNNCLEVLSANALNLDEKAIECIATSFPKLTFLDVGYCFSAVTDKTIQKIFKELTLLKTLRVSRCDKVSDAGLTGMGSGNRENIVEAKVEHKIPEVSGIKLRIRLGSRAEEEIVRDANRKREVLEMCEDTSPLDVDIASGFSLTRLRGLTELDLAGCNRVTDVSLKHAFMFLELRILDLSLCQQITHVGLDYLTKNNRAIEDLNLSQCHNVTDIGIVYVVQRLERLKRLHIRSCSQLTDFSLEAIKLYCKNLQYLDATSCPGISHTSVENLGNLHVKYSDQSGVLDTRDIPIPPLLQR